MSREALEWCLLLALKAGQDYEKEHGEKLEGYEALRKIIIREIEKIDRKAKKKGGK